MVVCTGAASDQCNAAQACNSAGGWHLCTASEYLARGGKVGKPPGLSWIASCIRAGGAPFAPTNAACTSCAEKAVNWAFVDFACSSSMGTTTNAGNVGVVARNACNRVGTNAPQNEGAWGMSYASATHTQSVCCK